MLFEAELSVDEGLGKSISLCRDAIKELQGSAPGDNLTFITDDMKEGILAAHVCPATRLHSIVAATVSPHENSGSSILLRSGALGWPPTYDGGENEKILQKIIDDLGQYANVTVVRPIHSPVSVFPPWRGPLSIKVP